MSWDMVVKEIKGEKGILVSREGTDQIEIPAKYLPSGCRKGDVIKLNISFDPFETLISINNEL